MKKNFMLVFFTFLFSCFIFSGCGNEKKSGISNEVFKAGKESENVVKQYESGELNTSEAKDELSYLLSDIGVYVSSDDNEYLDILSEEDEEEMSYADKNVCDAIKSFWIAPDATRAELDDALYDKTPTLTIFLIIGIIAWGIIWGAICRGIIYNKGYSDNWFWWGFFFGIIAFFVAIAKEPIRRSYENNDYESHLGNVAEKIRTNNMKTSGGWTCHWCDRLNESFTTTCACGRTKEENEQYYNNRKKKESKEKKESASEQDKAKALKDYGDLFKTGVITEEEFEKKKKELLGS